MIFCVEQKCEPCECCQGDDGSDGDERHDQEGNHIVDFELHAEQNHLWEKLKKRTADYRFSTGFFMFCQLNEYPNEIP